MEVQKKRPIREISDFLVHQVSRSTRQSHLETLRHLTDRVLLQRYNGEFELANEYIRVDVALREKERQLNPVDIRIPQPQSN